MGFEDCPPFCYIFFRHDSPQKTNGPQGRCSDLHSDGGRFCLYP